MKISKRGFTLIELLVVVAIIGILATIIILSLGGAREKARDSRRAADLVEMRNALEIYYARNLNYPLGSGTCNDSWNAVSATLVGSNLGFYRIPQDPMGEIRSYCYCSSDGQQYTLGAQLEDEMSKLMDSSISNPPCAFTGITACGQDGWYCASI